MTSPLPHPFPLSKTTLVKESSSDGVFDVRMNVKGRSGGSLVLELNSGFLVANSMVFGALIEDYRKSNVGVDGLFRIEVPEVENLSVFRETIELMFEEDIAKKIVNDGGYRAIDVLEVAAGIKFNRESQQNLTKQLVWSITTSSDNNARNELKALVGAVWQSSLNSMNDLLREAAGVESSGTSVKKLKEKPIVERMSKQVDNLHCCDIHRYGYQKAALQVRGKVETSQVMVQNYGWLQRCKKGLDIKELEEAMGQTLLTLPLKEQHGLFMDWFNCFSKPGTECPNLGKAFQICWWRSFL
ncbi:hypothetical protein OROMI_021905 [Orobanche minor]